VLLCRRSLSWGGAVVSARTEVHYLEFTMAASVQGWKKKWFYIKDQKTLLLTNTALPLLMPTKI
jgi:hypothetical protein